MGYTVWGGKLRRFCLGKADGFPKATSEWVFSHCQQPKGILEGGFCSYQITTDLLQVLYYPAEAGGKSREDPGGFVFFHFWVLLWPRPSLCILSRRSGKLLFASPVNLCFAIPQRYRQSPPPIRVRITEQLPWWLGKKELDQQTSWDQSRLPASYSWAASAFLITRHCTGGMALSCEAFVVS